MFLFHNRIRTKRHFSPGQELKYSKHTTIKNNGRGGENNRFSSPQSGLLVADFFFRNNWFRNRTCDGLRCRNHLCGLLPLLRRVLFRYRFLSLPAIAGGRYVGPGRHDLLEVYFSALRRTGDLSPVEHGTACFDAAASLVDLSAYSALFCLLRHMIHLRSSYSISGVFSPKMVYVHSTSLVLREPQAPDRERASKACTLWLSPNCRSKLPLKSAFGT